MKSSLAITLQQNCLHNPLYHSTMKGPCGSMCRHVRASRRPIESERDRVYAVWEHMRPCGSRCCHVRACAAMCAHLHGVHEKLDALALLKAPEEGDAPHRLLHSLLWRLVQIRNHVGHWQPASTGKHVSPSHAQLTALLEALMTCWAK